ncbi:MAG: site-2 protease family protein, partial [bacterium]|nr:site-2 protease family protein [bacterium]
DSEGLRAGDELLALASGADELQKLTPSAVAAFIERHAGEELTITYRRGGTTDVYETLITPAHGVIDETPGTPAIGIAMSLVALEKMPFHQAIVHGFAGTLEALKTVTVGLSAFFASLFAGGADWTQIAGPVGIAGLVGDASSVGLVYLLYFTAFISVNLAVINLIPIPALDGGRLLFLAIETAKGTPIRQGFATAMNVLGFGLIILLMVVVTYHDILRLLA